MNQINEQITFGKSPSCRRSFLQNVFFFRINYFSKATYLVGVKNLSIFADVGSYLLKKKLTTTEAKI